MPETEFMILQIKVWQQLKIELLDVTINKKIDNGRESS